jgi:hypothetical protein
MNQGRSRSEEIFSITCGADVEKKARNIYSNPKLVLISHVQALLHAGHLKIQKDLKEAPALIGELQDFRAEVTDSGYWRFGARAGKHDDLVLACDSTLARRQHPCADKMSPAGSPRHGRARCLMVRVAPTRWRSVCKH